MVRRVSGKSWKLAEGPETAQVIAGYRGIKVDIGGLNRNKTRNRWA
jgi:hypothetical protein